MLGYYKTWPTSHDHIYVNGNISTNVDLFSFLWAEGDEEFDQAKSFEFHSCNRISSTSQKNFFTYYYVKITSFRFVTFHKDGMTYRI